MKRAVAVASCYAAGMPAQQCADVFGMTLEGAKSAVKSVRYWLRIHRGAWVVDRIDLERALTACWADGVTPGAANWEQWDAHQWAQSQSSSRIAG